jgi:predicted Zn-dependent peptidase
MRPLAAALTTVWATLALPGLLWAQPPAGPAGIQRFTLPNGLRVVHLEDHERPLVRIRLQLDLEPGDGPPGRPELAVLALRMLDQADAGSLKAQDIDEALEGSGIRLIQGLDHEGISWRLAARSRDQDRALGLLADRVLRAVFDPFVLELQRLACWREAGRLDASPHARLRRALEPEQSLRTPTIAGLGAVTLEDLLAFRARAFRPDRAVLILHGDLGLEQAKRLVLLSFGTWTAAPPAPPASVAPALNAPAATTPATPSPAATEPGPLLIPAPGAPLRAQVVAAAPADLAPEAEALLRLLLPGDPALFPAKLRIEPPCLVATLDGETSARVARASLGARLEALRSRGFTEADLRRARAAWTAGRALLTLHPEARIAEAMKEIRGRAVHPARLEALTLEALNGALRRWLEPARLRIGLTGDPEVLKKI